MTLPLTGYLNSGSVYCGFDVHAEAVDWCRRHISAKFPNFQFFQLDVYNRQYNRSGRVDGVNAVFPFADGSFDFALATSVFTHLMPDHCGREPWPTRTWWWYSGLSTDRETGLVYST